MKLIAHLVAEHIFGFFGPGTDLDWFANGRTGISCRDVDCLQT